MDVPIMAKKYGLARRQMDELDDKLKRANLRARSAKETGAMAVRSSRGVQIGGTVVGAMGAGVIEGVIEDSFGGSPMLSSGINGTAGTLLGLASLLDWGPWVGATFSGVSAGLLAAPARSIGRNAVTRVMSFGATDETVASE